MKPKIFITGAVTVWVCLCAFLTAQLIEFGTRPGQKAQTVSEFPAASNLKLATGKYTVLAFLHPQCPCSKASISELEELMQRCGNKATTYALFLKPNGCSEKFARSALFEQTSRIKGVNAIVDENGREAKIFGSQTSGQLMVYNPKGHLVFAGGITPSRGHEGDNFGLDAASQIIDEKKRTFDCTDVYGCPLFASNICDSSGRKR